MDKNIKRYFSPPIELAMVTKWDKITPEWWKCTQGVLRGASCLHPSPEMGSATRAKTSNTVLYSGPVSSVLWTSSKGTIVHKDLHASAARTILQALCTFKRNWSERPWWDITAWYASFCAVESERRVLLTVALRNHLALVSLSFSIFKNEGGSSMYPTEVLEKKIN